MVTFDAERAAALGADPLSACVLEDYLRDVEAAQQRYEWAAGDDEIEATAMELTVAKGRLSRLLREIRSASGIGQDGEAKQDAAAQRDGATGRMAAAK